VDAAEVVLLEFVLAPPPQPLHQLAHTGQPLAVLVAEPGLHHPAQRGVEVAVVQQVVGDLGEDVVGVELEAGLCAVPAAVAETDGHRTGPSPDPGTSPWCRRRPCSSAWRGAGPRARTRRRWRSRQASRCPPTRPRPGAWPGPC